MTITSKIGRGAIFSGETPLALTITIEQTGPMQITVHAGAFTSTGQRRKNRAGQWLPWIEEPKTYVLAADQVIDLTSDPLKPVAYDVDLISHGAQTDVLVKRKVVGAEEYGDPPAGWKKVHELLFEFTLPPGCADITPVDIYALTVKPGFPEGTTADDWKQQTGGT